jgi:hypothetical protein
VTLPSPSWPGDEPSRRAWIRLAALFSLGALTTGKRSEAADYTSAVEVFDTVDRLEAEVGAMLQALAAKAPVARQLARSLLVDQRTHRAARDQLRHRLKLPPAPRLGAGVTGEVTLATLRSSQEALVYAHAEGLPALGNARAVDVMARHMVELSRHLTVIDLWIESEGAGE